MKVFIVIKEDYDVWDIEGVFAKEGDADKLVDYWQKVGWTCNVFEHEVK